MVQKQTNENTRNQENAKQDTKRHGHRARKDEWQEPIKVRPKSKVTADERDEWPGPVKVQGNGAVQLCRNPKCAAPATGKTGDAQPELKDKTLKVQRRITSWRPRETAPQRHTAKACKEQNIKDGRSNAIMT